MPPGLETESIGGPGKAASSSLSLAENDAIGGQRYTAPLQVPLSPDSGESDHGWYVGSYAPVTESQLNAPLAPSKRSVTFTDLESAVIGHEDGVVGGEEVGEEKKPEWIKYPTVSDPTGVRRSVGSLDCLTRVNDVVAKSRGLKPSDIEPLHMSRARSEPVTLMELEAAESLRRLRRRSSLWRLWSGLKSFLPQAGGAARRPVPTFLCPICFENQPFVGRFHPQIQADDDDGDDVTLALYRNGSGMSGVANLDTPRGERDRAIGNLGTPRDGSMRGYGVGVGGGGGGMMENMGTPRSGGGGGGAYSSTCSHELCITCVRAYTEALISDGRTDVACPMAGHDGCRLVYSDADIQALVSDAHWDKFIRFKMKRENANYRECPNAKCQRLVLGSRKKPAMTCPHCGNSFCFFHSNAHPNTTCEEYANRIRAVERKTHRALRRDTRKKPCPKCRVVVEKSGGCNHMTCPHCTHQWCWICERQYTKDHYQLGNLLGCPGQQFAPTWDLCGCGCISVCLALRITLLLVVTMPVLLCGAAIVAALSLAYLPIGVLRVMGTDKENLRREDYKDITHLFALLFPVIHFVEDFRGAEERRMYGVVYVLAVVPCVVVCSPFFLLYGMLNGCTSICCMMGEEPAQ